MFHPRSLVIGGILDSVWKAVHNLMIESDDEECNLPTICRSLDSWISNDSFQENRRLSLRTSATLISGVTKLYKTSICKLLEDVKSLDENIIYRKRRRSNNSFTSSSYESSESADTPEQTRQEIINDFDTSFSPRKRMKTNSGPSNTMGNYSTNISSGESISTHSQRSSHGEARLESFSDQNGRSSKETENSTAPVSQKKDQGVQTSPVHINESNGDSSLSDCFDKELPYAYIFVHDNYRSRVPSKIILTSITSDVRNLN